MKDRAGNELNIGDRVLYLESTANKKTSFLVWGTIDKFTEHMVVFRVDTPWGIKDRRVTPDRVVKPKE